MARNLTIVSDGRTTWYGNSATRSYTQRTGPAPAALFNNAFPGLAREVSNTNLPAQMISARIVSAEALRIAGRIFACDVVEVTVRPGVAGERLEHNALRLWISREYKVPLKVQARFLRADGNGADDYLDFVTDFQTGIVFPSSIWRFEPPAGSIPSANSSN